MRRTFALVLAAFILVACDLPPKQKQVSSSGAEQVYSGKVAKNSRGRTVEQQSIDDRIKVTTDPTKIMWIHLIALDGKIVKRMAVRNKVTSSGKRLEPTHAVSNPNSGSTPPKAGDWYFTDELIQPDGTYGHSDPYIFWFDPVGRYHQWGTAGGLGYLLTDYPIDLEDQIDKMTGLYKANAAAAAWQAQEETKLRSAEGKK